MDTRRDPNRDVRIALRKVKKAMPEETDENTIILHVQRLLRNPEYEQEMIEQARESKEFPEDLKETLKRMSEHVKDK